MGSYILKKSLSGRRNMSKCNTCWGHGLWADGLPMGPIDAKDGMPTIECPECNADDNPSYIESNETKMEEFVKDIKKCLFKNTN